MKLKGGKIMAKHKYNLIRDPYDSRDLKYALSMEPAQVAQAAPLVSDLRGSCSPIENQGQTSSCTGHAIVGALEYDEIVQGETLIPLSRLFVYYNERLVEGMEFADSGACIRDGIKTIAQYGVCSEALWPFSEAAVLQKPSDEAYQDALKHKAIEYRRVDQTQEALLHCLGIDKRPIIVGIQIFESFESELTAATGVVSMPKPQEQLLGGHAVLIVGYDSTRQVFFMRNSWGTSWGMGGYFELPFSYILNPELAADLWTVSKIS
jgi:C1A family cysteine protease